MRLFELIENNITDKDLQQLETYADRLFASLGIDVEFSKHFKDRINDPRNTKPITMAELTRLFKQIYKQHGKPIAQLGPDAEAVMKDMRTDVNVPFALHWDGKELDLVAKTIMRKPNFATSNPEFAVEGKRIPRKKGQPAGSKKHSDLYTDENPKGTIQGLKFATVKDAEASVRKIKGSGKKHAHKIQAAIAMEQRAKAAGKKSAASVYRTYINQMKKKTKEMKESLVEAYMMDLNQNEDMLVLKVKDTDQKGHVEIRGKKNYETDGYDPKDPLHKVLDELDPATVAKLYGGEEVYLNPKNSRTAPAIAKAKELTKENFADGKVKGKSRPGRVKRSGASCKGSVTSLRAKAKKSSGEKAKMYHWCANMKSGRQKK